VLRRRGRPVRERRRGRGRAARLHRQPARLVVHGGVRMTATDTDTAGEQHPMADRAARLVLLAVLLLAMWGIVAVLPETAYVVVGVLATLGVQRARAWREGRRHTGGEEPPRPDVGAALRRLIGDDRGVLLTRLRDAPRVRTAAGNGPGVHADDIPAPPPTGEDGCCCRSDANANANNAAGEGAGEGLRVERIGQSGYIIRDPADLIRHHEVRGK